MRKKRTRFQERMTKIVWVSVIYGFGGAVTHSIYDTSVESKLIYFGILTVLFVLAAGFDAVFDSINDRINIQSSWLHARFSVLEKATDSESGQTRWKSEAVPTDDGAHYFACFPERIDDPDSTFIN